MERKPLSDILPDPQREYLNRKVPELWAMFAAAAMTPEGVDIAGAASDADQMLTQFRRRFLPAAPVAAELPDTAPPGQASKRDPLGDLFFLPPGTDPGD